MKLNSLTNYIKPECSSWVCIIGAGKSQLPFIRRAMELGLNTLVFDQNPLSEARTISNIFVPLSTHECDAIKQYCIELQGRVSIISCFSSSSHERALTTVATVNDHFRLPGIRKRMLKRTSSKHEMHNVLRSVGLYTPHYNYLNTLDDLRSFIKTNGATLIKPAKGGVGSIGVSLVSDNSEELDQKLNDAMANSSDGFILAEKFIEGAEYSVDGYVDALECHILSISSKNVTRNSDYFLIKKFVTEVADSAVFCSLCKTAKTAVGALGLNDTFFSFDILSADGKLYIIDAGLQLDAKIDRLLNFAGVDVYSIPFRACANKAGSVGATIPPGYELEFLYAESDGVISFLAYSRSSKNHLIEFEKRVGEHVRKPSSVSDLIGWICRKGGPGSIDLGDDSLPSSSLFKVSADRRASK